MGKILVVARQDGKDLVALNTLNGSVAVCVLSPK